MRINMRKLLKLPVLQVVFWNKITGELTYTGAIFRAVKCTTLENNEKWARIVAH